MKKLFLIFTVLFTCALPVSGFGVLNDFDAKFQEFQTRQQQQLQRFQARQQQQYNDFQSRNQQEIAQFRKRSDDKIAEIKKKSKEAFEKLEQAYNDFIKGTPFENCIPGWSYLECKQVNNLSKSTWSCKLKSGITAQKMNSDVEAYCTQKSEAFEYDPLDDFEEPENEEDEDGRVRITATVEEIPEELKTNTYKQDTTNSNTPTAKTLKTSNDLMLKSAFQKYCDDEGYTVKSSTRETNLPGAVYGTYNAQCNAPTSIITITCYKKKKNVTFSPADLAHYCSQEKTNQFELTENPNARPSTHIRDCNTNEKKAINATDCKISPDGKYSDIKCDTQKGYWLNANLTACEKSGRQETNKKCTQEQLTQLNAQSGKLYYYAETPNTQYCGITQCKNNFVINNDDPQEKCVCPSNNGFELKDGKCVKKNDTNTINIIGTVVDGDSTNKQPIKWVYIKYDEGKKNPGQMRTGGNGKFNIDVIPGTTVTFEHTDYKTQTAQFNIKTESIEIQMVPKEETKNKAALQALCEDGNKGTWNKTSEDCKCKDKTATFNTSKGCVPAELLSLKGTVQDAEQKPMPNVKIKFGKQSTQTDASGNFELQAIQGTQITFSHKGYKDYEYTLTATNTTYTATMEPTDKAANNAKKQTLCEKNGKGEWKPKLNKCNCKGKAFFDGDEGCIESTQDFLDEQAKLNSLYEQFTAQLDKIKISIQQQ